MSRLKKIISMALALSMVLGLTGFAGAAEESEITLIGANYGTMQSVAVEDCTELTSALELNCTSAPTQNGFGINIPTAQFSLVSGNVYVLSFYSKLTNEFDTLTVSINDASGTKLTGFTYHLSGQWTKICVPFTATGDEANITMTTGGKLQKMYIGGISVEESSTTFEEAQSGYFMVKSDEWESADISWGTGLGVGACMDIVATDEYIYALAGSKLHTFKIGERGENPTLVNSTQAYGELRQMSITEDEKGLVVVARANEGFVFDISDPEEPVLASRLDSLEAATGIDVHGKYCYIADRTFGIDIFDISDLYNPVMVSNIQTGETQDCKAYNGYVYAGVWADCKVIVCDARDPDNPSVVGEINLKGRGDGLNIKNGTLYVATGHMEKNTPQATSPGYAIGNGMEIYDITDPENPELLSRVRAEGRMYCSYPDIWRVEVSGNYAYLSSSYNGIYVYDTTNKKLPKRLAHINVVANKGEDGYSYSTPKSTWVYPYDLEEKRVGALIDCYVKNGTLYIANQSSDLYTLHGKDYIADNVDKNDSTVSPADNYKGTYFTNDLEAMGLKNPKLFKPAGQVWSCARYGNYTYVAAGIDGIYVIDDNMNIIKNYPTKDITNDVRIYENKLYSAENTAGMFIYEIDVENPENLTLKGSYAQGSSPIVEIALSPDAKYALVQKGHASALINVSDITNPTLHQNFNYKMVYQNQISRYCAQNRYLIVFASGSKTVVCDFGENGSYTEPVITESWTSGLSASNGISADGDLMLATMGRNVYSFDPSDENVYTSKLADNTSINAFSVANLSGGAPTVIGDYAFIASRRRGYFTMLKLADDRSSAPTILEKLYFVGNPERVESVGNRIYLPISYGGLVSFDLADLNQNLSTLSALSYKADNGVKGAVSGFKASDVGGEYEISVSSDAKKVEILATPTMSESIVTISNNGVIDIANGGREAVVTVSNGEFTSEFKINVNITKNLVDLDNSKTYTVPGYENIRMRIAVNPLITAVRADSGDNLIYPEAPVEDGAKLYTDRTAEQILYLDVGNNLKGATPILNPITDVREDTQKQSTIGDTYYYRFVADRAGTVIVKCYSAIPAYDNDTSWTKVVENTTGASKTDLKSYVMTDDGVIPSWYEYTASSDYPYYFTLYQYAANGSAKKNYFTNYKYTYYKHFEENETVDISRVGVPVGTVKHNIVTMINWDEDSAASTDANKQYSLKAVAVSGTIYNVTSNENWYTAKTSYYPADTSMTLRAVADSTSTFLYWKDVDSGKLISTDSEITVTVGTGKNIAAIFSDSTQGYIVTFKDINNKIILSQYDTENITVPENSYIMGYTFRGWSDGSDKLISAGNVINASDIDADTIYSAGYTVDETTYTVTISGAEQSSGSYKYNEKVTLSPAGESGKTFAYWTKDSNIVSYDENYSFYVNADCTVEAVYTSEAPVKEPLLVMAKPVLVSGSKIAFFLERNIPEEYEFIESGILMGTSENMTVNEYGVKAKSSSSNKIGQFTVRKAGVKSGETWYGVGYAIYKDGDTVCIKYTSPVSYTVE